MNWVIGCARSVDVTRSDRDLGSVMSVINETLRDRGRGARV